ncbi:MAG: hypothetical protein JEZ06_21470 [Anaerolineaceae bacterium]|nr:hypothetical protein [Anaerolineaceae bacterium]
MKVFWVGGSYVPRQEHLSTMEPFSLTLSAKNKMHALQIATKALNGGSWVMKPKIKQSSEEKRMRSIGAPELPGF